MPLRDPPCAKAPAAPLASGRERIMQPAQHPMDVAGLASGAASTGASVRHPSMQRALLQLQRQYGNHHVGLLLSRSSRAGGQSGVIHRQAANPDGQAPAAPAPPDKALYYYRGVVMTTDEAFMTGELQRLVAREGLAGAQAWYAAMVADRGIPPQLVGTGISAHGYGGGTRVRSPLDAQKDMMQEQLAAECFPVVVRVFASVEAAALKFLNDFDLRSKVVLEAMLVLSETKIQEEQKRYGLQTTGMPVVLANPQMTKTYGPTDYVGAAYSMAEGPAKKSLTAAARKLAATLRKLSAKWGDQLRYLGTIEGGESGMGTLYVKDEPGHARWQKEFDDLAFDYLLDRAQSVAEFPILAAFATMTTKGTGALDSSAGKLEGIATGSGADVAQTLNKEINEKLANIYKTRWSVDQGELSMWSLDSIVAGTRSALGVQAGTMQDRLVSDKVEHERSRKGVAELALGVIAIALGLLAAIPTGGSSLAAGIAVAAGVGSAALSVTIAYSDLKEYAVQSAASGTDFEKAQAISHDDPSMFWLALSILGAVVDLGAAVKAFKALTPAARQLREAKRLAALGRALGAEEQAAVKTAREALSRESEKYPGLAEKIEAHVAHAGGEEAKNAERFAARWQEGLNPETRALLDASPDVKGRYRDMDPLVRDVLTYCASCCIIPNITKRQAAEVRDIVFAYGGLELDGLRQYFHFRRNELDVALKQLREAGSRGFKEVESLLQHTLTSSPIQAEEDAIATWQRLQKPGTSVDSKAEFIEKYRAGLRFDELTGVWYNPVRGLKDTVPLGATASEAFLTFRNSEGFASFQALLVDEKLIAGEGDLIAALEAMKPSPPGRTVDAVRHSLKDLYREALLARMTKPDMAVMRVRYPGLPWHDVDQAMRQASYQEMRRMTDGLAPADKGNLYEQWHKAVLSPTAVQHVGIAEGTLKNLGSLHGTGRVIDLLEGDTIHELKRVAGEMSKAEKAQFADNMLMVSKKLPLGGQPVRRVLYTLPIPEGVQANARWMAEELAIHPGVLSFEVFNATGDRRVITAAAELARPELWTWLGLVKP
jgi:hypothetical protein